MSHIIVLQGAREAVFETVTLISDELPYICDEDSVKEGWLRAALNDPALTVFNAPRPLFGDAWPMGSFSGPRGRFVTVMRIDDQHKRELAWENHRQDATILKIIGVKEARAAADATRPVEYDTMMNIWEQVWRDAWIDAFRLGTQTVDVWARY